MDTSSTVQYKVEAVKKEGAESDLDSIRRVVLEHAKLGWILVEASGDENLMPSLIFEKSANAANEMLVEQIVKKEGEDELMQVQEQLNQWNNAGWLPLTVLDSIFTHPIAVLEKVTSTPADADLMVTTVTAGVFESVPKAILEEVETQSASNKTLKTIMNSGLHPILIFGGNTAGTKYKYEVEYAQGGLFSNRTKELAKLIEHRAGEGWHVCGAFEDSFRMPCVVFRRTASQA